MKSAEDIESYLMRAGVPYERINPGFWVVKLDSQEAVGAGASAGAGAGMALAVSIAGPVVAFRLKVMDVPRAGVESLYRTLLSLNTTEMVHGAFGLEGDAVVIVHALELENLDFNEFQAVLDDMAMAISKHYPFLSKFVEHRAPAAPASSPPV